SGIMPARSLPAVPAVCPVPETARPGAPGGTRGSSPSRSAGRDGTGVPGPRPSPRRTGPSARSRRLRLGRLLASGCPGLAARLLHRLLALLLAHRRQPRLRSAGGRIGTTRLHTVQIPFACILLGRLVSRRLCLRCVATRPLLASDNRKTLAFRQSLDGLDHFR